MPAPRVGLHEEREERRDPIDPRRHPGHTEEKGKPGRLLEQEQFVVFLNVARLQPITAPPTLSSPLHASKSAGTDIVMPMDEDWILTKNSLNCLRPLFSCSLPNV